jgi:Na+/H+-dicarboxylate symporter
MMVVVKWVLILAPIGVFALALGLGSVMGASAAGALLYYVIIMAVVLLTFTLLLYPAVRIFTGVPFRTFAAAAGPAQGIALGSRSSLAALPAVIAGARDQLRSPESVTGFALPLAVSVFRVNVPMAWVVGVLFLSRLYGVELDMVQLITLVLLSTFISFSVPGIPSASLFLMAPVLVNMGIPPEGAAILISVDAIPDMFKTAVNVTSHSAVAAVMSRGADTGQVEAQGQV